MNKRITTTVDNSCFAGHVLPVNRRFFQGDGARMGFSLVEMLVVFLVIGVLSILILTVLTKARESAFASSCIYNLRQWGSVFAAYEGEHNGELPVNEALRPGTTNSWIPWYELMAPYVGYAYEDDVIRPTRIKRTILACPAESGIAGGIAPTTETYICYAMNKDLDYRLIKEKAIIKMGSLHNARSYAILSDAWQKAILYNDSADKMTTQTRINRRHSGIPNFLYADGHAEKFTLPIYGTGDCPADLRSFYLNLWYANGVSPNER